MGVLYESVAGLIGGTNTPDVVHECRRCGTSVSGEADDCPNCGPETEIVEHELN